jgi:hypothetical protein
VSKSMAMLFTRRRIQTPRPVALFGEPKVWVDTARYLEVTLDKGLTWSTYIDRDRTRRHQDSKRKASHLDSDSSGEPATRRPAQEPASESKLCVLTPAEVQVSQSSQEPNRPAYAVVAAGRAALLQSGSLKPTAMESDSSDTAASFEAAHRRLSQDLPWPLSDTGSHNFCA